MTYVGQKFCVVVYPQMDSKADDAGLELKEEKSPLSGEDEETQKSDR